MTRDLRAFIARVEQSSVLRRVAGADPVHELGAITEVAATSTERLWAVATRCEPADQLDIVRGGWSSALDPRIAPAERARGVSSHSKMIIDACRPFSWRSEFPKPSALDAEEARRVAAKWHDVLFRATPSAHRTLPT